MSPAVSAPGTVYRMMDMDKDPQKQDYAAHIPLVLMPAVMQPGRMAVTVPVVQTS